jgi:hypothetical protein
MKVSAQFQSSGSVPMGKDPAINLTGGSVDPQSRYKHSGEESNILPLLGIEYGFIDCLAGALVATVTEPNQMKSKEQLHC